MFAGTLTRIDPIESALTDEFNGENRPVLAVDSTQHDLDGDRPVQAGMASAYVDSNREEVHIDGGDDVQIMTERVETREQVATSWVADVTGTGLVVPQTIAGSGDLDFPLDLFFAVTGERPERLTVDVGRLHARWEDDDVLGEAWMNGGDEWDGGSTIDYNANASARDKPSIGLGFARPFGNTSVRGVVYRSGYVACYDASTATQFVRFLEAEVLPYTFVPEDEDEQQTLTEEEMKEVTA